MERWRGVRAMIYEMRSADRLLKIENNGNGEVAKKMMIFFGVAGAFTTR